MNNNNEENNSDISYYSKGTIELFSTFVDQGDSWTSEGMIILENEEAFFDFDSGKIVNDSRADVYLFVGCGNRCATFMLVINDSKVIWVDKNIIPDYQRCKEELSTPFKDMGVLSSPGRYSCVLTNENRIVQLLIIEKETININGRVVFQYIVWP